MKSKDRLGSFGSTLYGCVSRRGRCRLDSAPGCQGHSGRWVSEMPIEAQYYITAVDMRLKQMPDRFFEKDRVK